MKRDRNSCSSSHAQHTYIRLHTCIHKLTGSESEIETHDSQEHDMLAMAVPPMTMVCRDGVATFKAIIDRTQAIEFVNMHSCIPVYGHVVCVCFGIVAYGRALVFKAVCVRVGRKILEAKGKSRSTTFVQCAKRNFQTA